MKSCHLQQYDGAKGYNAKCNKSVKDKYHAISLTCGIYETKMNKEKRDKPKNRLLTIENKLVVTRGEVRGGWVK